MGEASPSSKPDPSTLVRKGQDAVTFPEIEAFLRDIETRPLNHLIMDLPSLLALGESKFHLVALALRRRLRGNDPAREAILVRLRQIAESATDSSTRERARSIDTARPSG